DKREQSPRLPVMVLLESEVRELADAHVYFDAKNEKSAMAVDLLLGTQGWRRFALVHWQKFVEQHKDQARRVLALYAPQPVRDFSDAFAFAAEGKAGRVRILAAAEGIVLPAAAVPKSESSAKGAAPQDKLVREQKQL